MWVPTPSAMLWFRLIKVEAVTLRCIGAQGRHEAMYSGSLQPSLPISWALVFCLLPLDEPAENVPELQFWRHTSKRTVFIDEDKAGGPFSSKEE